MSTIGNNYFAIGNETRWRTLYCLSLLLCPGQSHSSQACSVPVSLGEGRTQHPPTAMLPQTTEMEPIPPFHPDIIYVG
ncbi:hypothetical protein Pcinc_012261 [Petrolisthes cinctipes]|uniref:Uncharacterized protein n=1 Tax=Petrolisthes cinctipes TaxID=88211 RepID=A0AAE1G579_PETCI|nr:hypothetical protein Pcinc_012261 [Petrolisthes cinctipes]